MVLDPIASPIGKADPYPDWAPLAEPLRLPLSAFALPISQMTVEQPRSLLYEVFERKAYSIRMENIGLSSQSILKEFRKTSHS